MKLKDNVVFEYNDIAQAYSFNLKGLKVKKVTGRMFPILLGKNKYNSIGFGVLDRCGLIDFVEIDLWYKVRGAVAEHFAYLFIEKMYKSYGIDIKMKAFTTKGVNYDNFPKNNKFGGVLDIGISEPQNQRAVVEVKSKNTKYKGKFLNDNEFWEEEVLQGKMMSALSGVDKLLMAYVFFTDEQESLFQRTVGDVKDPDDFNVPLYVKELGLKLEDIDVQIGRFDVDKKEVEKEMEKAYENLHRLVNLGGIHKSHFNQSESDYLDGLLRFKSGVSKIEGSPF